MNVPTALLVYVLLRSWDGGHLANMTTILFCLVGDHLWVRVWECQSTRRGGEGQVTLRQNDRLVEGHNL